MTYKIEHGLRYVNKNVNNKTSLQTAQISFIDEKLDVYFKKIAYFSKFLSLNV